MLVGRDLYINIYANFYRVCLILKTIPASKKKMVNEVLFYLYDIKFRKSSIILFQARYSFLHPIFGPTSIHIFFGSDNWRRDRFYLLLKLIFDFFFKFASLLFNILELFQKVPTMLFIDANVKTVCCYCGLSLHKNSLSRFEKSCTTRTKSCRKEYIFSAKLRRKRNITLLQSRQCQFQPQKNTDVAKNIFQFVLLVKAQKIRNRQTSASSRYYCGFGHKFLKVTEIKYLGTSSQLFSICWSTVISSEVKKTSSILPQLIILSCSWRINWNMSSKVCSVQSRKK